MLFYMVPRPQLLFLSIIVNVTRHGERHHFAESSSTPSRRLSLDGQAGIVGGATRGVGFLSALGPGENARVSFMEEMVH